MEEEFVVLIEMEGGERFEDAGNIELYREASDAKNTKKSTNTWVRAFNEWRVTELLVLTWHVLSYPPELAHNTTDFRKLTLLIFTREYKFS